MFPYADEYSRLEMHRQYVDDLARTAATHRRLRELPDPHRRATRWSRLSRWPRLARWSRRRTSDVPA